MVGGLEDGVAEKFDLGRSASGVIGALVGVDEELHGEVEGLVGVETVDEEAGLGGELGVEGRERGVGRKNEDATAGGGPGELEDEGEGGRCQRGNR